MVNSIQATQYLSNIAKSAILPLFLISILDFLNKIKEKASEILTTRIDSSYIDLTEATVKYENLYPLKQYDLNGEVQYWFNKKERLSNVLFNYHLLNIKIEKYFKWIPPVYIICFFFLLFSLFFAQYPDWILFNQRLNDDTLTLWTFALLLGDITFTDSLANTLISYTEKKYKKEM